MCAVALVVTTAHVVTDVLNLLYNYIKCKVDGYDEAFNDFARNKDHNKYSDDALSSNGASYCVGEGDITLMLYLLTTISFYIMN